MGGGLFCYCISSFLSCHYFQFFHGAIMFVEDFIKLLGFRRNRIPSYEVQTHGMVQRAHFKSSSSIEKSLPNSYALFFLGNRVSACSHGVQRVSSGFLSNVALAFQTHHL